MITNKNRKRFLPTATRNFLEQSYKDKTLIIINHSPEEELDIPKHDAIFQVKVDKEGQGFTLGGLRNVALNAFVPDGGYWTPWDDDDYKHPHYLELFMRRMTNLNLDLLFLKNRLEVNLNNKFVFRSQFTRGWAFFFARKIKEFQYLDLDTMEDKNVRQVYEGAKKTVRMFNNDPRLYIRTIHNTNTSVFVDNEKTAIVQYSSSNPYQEFEATEKERQYVLNIVDKYYK